MKRKNPTKAQCAAFQASVAATIGRPPDETDCIGGQSWKLSTDYGPVSVSTHAGNHNSVFLRFMDHSPEVSARWKKDFWRSGFPDSVNPYSGKWNVNAFVHPAPETAEDILTESQAALGYLRQKLRKVGFIPAPLNPAPVSTPAPQPASPATRHPLNR